jgi:hypothetical protein
VPLGADVEAGGLIPGGGVALGEVPSGVASPAPDLPGVEARLETSDRAAEGDRVGAAGPGGGMGLGSDLSIPGGAASSTGAPHVSQNSPSRSIGLLQNRQRTLPAALDMPRGATTSCSAVSGEAGAGPGTSALAGEDGILAGGAAAGGVDLEALSGGLGVMVLARTGLGGEGSAEPV